MTDAMQKKKTSHIYQHLKIAHPEWLEMDWNNMFRFEVESANKSAFDRQLREAVRMKNTQAVVLNSKDEYQRCIVPDIPLTDRGWVAGGPQRPEARTDSTPKQREVRLKLEEQKPDKKTNTRRKRLKTIEFRIQKNKNSKRKKYKKVTKETGRLKKTNYQYWEELREKSKQKEYQEDFSKVNRPRGEKRKKSKVQEEETERKAQEKQKKIQSKLKAREEKQLERSKRVERSGRKLTLENPNEKSKLGKLNTPIRKQISAAGQEQPSKGPGAIRGGPIKQLESRGIKVGARQIILSKPVKVNGKIVLNGGITGAKSRKIKGKLSFNSISEEPDPDLKIDQ